MQRTWTFTPTLQQITGMRLAHFNSGSNMAPCIKPWHTVGSYPAIGGFTAVRGITFARFRVNPCGRRDVAIGTNLDSPDATHPGSFASVEIVDTQSDSLAKMEPPQAGWIQIADCVDMDCDGPKHVLIQVRGVGPWKTSLNVTMVTLITAAPVLFRTWTGRFSVPLAPEPSYPERSTFVALCLRCSVFV
jgi:hypothetical protein